VLSDTETQAFVIIDVGSYVLQIYCINAVRWVESVFDVSAPLVQEIYGNTRMLLACLPRQELELVCGGCSCHMWEVLAPMRAARPANGGPGCDMELALDLQMLYLEIGGGAQAAEMAG
jgi:hypothetical protein